MHKASRAQRQTAHPALIARWLVCMVLLASGVACVRDFALPAPIQPPIIQSIAPVQAFAGTPLTVTGTSLGNDLAAIEVRVGASALLNPSALSNDGTSLTLIVPDDATDGPVSVSFRGFTASSATSFTMLGLGHLAFGRISRTVDLRAQFSNIVGFSGLTAFVVGFPFANNYSLGMVALADPGNYSFGTNTLAEPAQLIGGSFGVLATDASGARLVVSDYGSNACPSGRITLWESGSPPAASSTVCYDGMGYAILSLAADATADHVVGVTPFEIVLIDFTQSPAQVSTFPFSSADGSDALFDAVWAGGSHFLVSSIMGILPVDPTAATPIGDPLVFTDPDAQLLGTELLELAASPNKIAAGSDISDGFLLLDLSIWPPQSKGVTPLYDNQQLTAMAVAPDGNHLYLANTTGRVTTWDISATPLPIASVVSDGVLSLSTNAAGQVLAGRLGGIDLLDQQSGALIDPLDIPSGFIDPRIHGPITAFGTSSNPTGSGLAVASTFYNMIFDLDTSTLELNTTVLLDPPTINELEATSGTGALISRHGCELRRYNSDGSIDISELGSTAQNCGPVTLSTEQDLLVATVDSQLGLLPLSESWNPSAQPVQIAQPASFTGFAGPDSIVVAYSDPQTQNVTIERIDSTEAKQGLTSVKSTLQAVPYYYDVNLVAGYGDVVAFADTLSWFHSDGTTTSAMIPMWLASGGLQEIGSVESSANDISPPMILSPSKQWVWWLGGPLPRSLVTLEMDPVTGAAVQLNERIDLPPGASQFVATPDGEHILVLDPDAEQLLLLE